MGLLIERTGADRDPEGPGGLRRTVAGTVREGTDPNQEIGGAEMGDGHHGTETEIAIATGTVTGTETETEIADVDPRVREGGMTAVVARLGPAGWKKPNSLHRQRGRRRGGLLRFNGWPPQPERDTTGPLAQRPLPWHTGAPLSTMGAPEPSCRRRASRTSTPSGRAIQGRRAAHPRLRAG